MLIGYSYFDVLSIFVIPAPELWRPVILYLKLTFLSNMLVITSVRILFLFYNLTQWKFLLQSFVINLNPEIPVEFWDFYKISLKFKFL